MGKPKNTVIQLFGWGHRLCHGFIDKKTFTKFTGNPVDFFECEEATSEFGLYGPEPDKFVLLINGKEECSSLDDLKRSYSVETTPTKLISFPPRKKYCLITFEEDKGYWSSITIEGKFDPSKLHFQLNTIDFDEENQHQWITMNYDGVETDTEPDTDTKSMGAYIQTNGCEFIDIDTSSD